LILELEKHPYYSNTRSLGTVLKIGEEMMAYYLGKDAKYTVGYETTGERAETI